MQPSTKFKRHRREIPLFTSRVESRLTDLIGEPIALAQKFLRPKFEQELSFNEGNNVRYVYDNQKCLSFYDHYPARSTYLFEPAFLIPSSAITQRNYQFRVELVENVDGKLSSFRFTLQVSQ